MGAGIKKRMPRSLTLNCATWDKDSHGLFDYETSLVSKQKLSISEACQIVRKQKQIEVADRSYHIEKSSEDVRTLLHIGKIRDQFWVYSELPLAPQTQEEMWIVLRNYVNEEGKPGHRIRKDDIIKMGRCKYSVKELVTVPEEHLQADNFDKTSGEAESPHVHTNPAQRMELGSHCELEQKEEDQVPKANILEGRATIQGPPMSNGREEGKESGKENQPNLRSEAKEEGKENPEQKEQRDTLQARSKDENKEENNEKENKNENEAEAEAEKEKEREKNIETEKGELERDRDKEKKKDSDTGNKQKEELQCRICLGDDSTPTNPLIQSPCACTGTVKLMHIECLKQWLHGKVTEKRTECGMTYTWKQFECDVCKAKYPGKVVKVKE